MIPVDDAALDAIEHALGATLVRSGDGAASVTGADYQLTQLLDFWAGVDQSSEGTFVGFGDPVGIGSDLPVYDCTDVASYHTNDLIAALIAEIRRLRGDA